MKGIIFTEFLDFVTATHGPETTDDIIDAADLPNSGAYTAVGTYPYKDLEALVVALAAATQAKVPDLLVAFGHHLCGRFTVRYPEFFQSDDCLFAFLASVDRHIHVEVHKLYPDAELPVFNIKSQNAEVMEFDYRSCRPLEFLAEGMIRAAADHFGSPVTIARRPVEDQQGPCVRFMIKRAA